MRDGSIHVRSSGRAYITATAVVTAGAGPHRHNLGMMRSAYNPRQCVLQRASAYRVGAGAGAAGNGDGAGVAAAGFGFGFFGLSGFRTGLGGGPAG